MFDALTPLHGPEAIADRVSALAVEMAERLPARITVVVVLRGAYVFAADLTRALHRAGVDTRVDFLTLASYYDGRKSTNSVKVVAPPAMDLRGRDVLLVDDILDTGQTLARAVELLRAMRPSSLHTAVLLDKVRSEPPVCTADFVGFEIPDRFVVGYGLDYAQSYRDLPFIGVLPDGTG